MPVTATEAPPEIDNIYLDMNGIIHNCTHANDPTLRLTETEMVLRIFMYLDKLIHITKPKKLVFLAIDGAHASVAASNSVLYDRQLWQLCALVCLCPKASSRRTMLGRGGLCVVLWQQCYKCCASAHAVGMSCSSRLASSHERVAIPWRLRCVLQVWRLVPR
jgi:hypothetical protein